MRCCSCAGMMVRFTVDDDALAFPRGDDEDEDSSGGVQEAGAWCAGGPSAGAGTIMWTPFKLNTYVFVKREDSLSAQTSGHVRL